MKRESKRTDIPKRLRPTDAMPQIAQKFAAAGRASLEWQEAQRKAARILSTIDGLKLSPRDLDYLKILLKQEHEYDTIVERGEQPTQPKGLTVRQLTKQYGRASESAVSADMIRLWKSQPQVILKTIEPEFAGQQLRLSEIGRQVAQRDVEADNERWSAWEDMVSECDKNMPGFRDTIVKFFDAVAGVALKAVEKLRADSER